MAFRPLIRIGALAGAALMLTVAPASAAWLAGGAGSTSSTGLAMPPGNVPSPSVAPGSGDVTLNWAPSTLDVALVGYRIQRFPDAGGPGIAPGAGCAGIVAAVSCTESSVPAGQWRYSVTPVLDNWAGAPSAMSASVAVPPMAPNGLTATPSPPTNIDLTWSPVTGATSYTVYRSTSVAGPFNTPIGSTASPSFADTPPAAGTVYSYVVTAVADGVESATSNVSTATAPSATQAGPVGNPGFESGALAPWIGAPASTGDVEAVTSFAATGWSYSPVSGAYFALLTAGAANTYSHLSQSIDVAAGDTVSGSAFFMSGDYMPYNDDGAVVIEQDGVDVATVFASSVSAIGQYTGTAWTAWSYTFPSAGTYTIDARVRNSTDGENPSWLGMDDLSYTSANLSEAVTAPRSGSLAVRAARSTATLRGARPVVASGPYRVTVPPHPTSTVPILATTTVPPASTVKVTGSTTTTTAPPSTSTTTALP